MMTFREYLIKSFIVQDGRYDHIDISKYYVPTADIIDGRRVGNSTRLIDDSIKILFSGKSLAVVNHGGVVNQLSNIYLSDQIKKRLDYEHGITDFESGFVYGCFPTIRLKMDT